jgi:hypothetical protein
MLGPIAVQFSQNLQRTHYITTISLVNLLYLVAVRNPANAAAGKKLSPAAASTGCGRNFLCHVRGLGTKTQAGAKAPVRAIVTLIGCPIRARAHQMHVPICCNARRTASRLRRTAGSSRPPRREEGAQQGGTLRFLDAADHLGPVMTGGVGENLRAMLHAAALWVISTEIEPPHPGE